MHVRLPVFAALLVPPLSPPPPLPIAGSTLYREGPTRPGPDDEPLPDDVVDDGWRWSEAASEGSFRIYAEAQGVYAIRVTNPSPSSTRTLSFAWLLGKDDDDPYNGDGDVDDGYWELNPASGVDEWRPRNATAYIKAIAARASSIHQKLDSLAALQAYADVRYARHLRTAESTRNRVGVWALAEAAASLIAAALSVVLIRRFDFKGPSLPSTHTWV